MCSITTRPMIPKHARQEGRSAQRLTATTVLNPHLEAELPCGPTREQHGARWAWPGRAHPAAGGRSGGCVQLEAMPECLRKHPHFPGH